MNSDVTVMVKCEKFYSQDEFENLLKDYDCTVSDFCEKDGCVFCVEAELDGVKGMACFY